MPAHTIPFPASADGSAAPTLAVHDPATGERIGDVPVCEPAEAATLVTAARASAPAWARTHPEERAGALREWADRMEREADAIAAVQTREMGEPIADSRGGVRAAIGAIRQYAELGPLHRGRSLQGAWDATDLMVQEPFGVAVVLVPWNDPAAIARQMTAAALAVGNTVILKPSERAPLAAARAGGLARLPEGVLRTACGDGGTKDALVVDADVDPAWAARQGAPPPGPGAFMPPTVVRVDDDASPLMREEPFGPVAAVRVVDDFAEGLARADDSPYGLAATVLTASQRHAQEAWRTLTVGTVTINAVWGGAPGGPAHPRRASGSGAGYGPELLDELTRVTIVHAGPAVPPGG